LGFDPLDHLFNCQPFEMTRLAAKSSFTGEVNMSSSTSKRSELKRKREQQRKQATIGVIVAGLVVLVAVGILWGMSLASKPQANQAVATEVPQAAAAAAPTVNAKQYASAPPMTIDAKKQYFATFKMAKGGEFVIQLYPDKAPITVNSFVFLARDGFFNGVTFHRVLEGFMAQGGDPTGTGMGGPGYEFVNEDSDLKFDKAGVLAMANAGRDTNGSQFFITFGPTPDLDGGYTIFGQVTSGMEVVNAITRRDPQTNPSFTGDVIASVIISEK
jgi:cyclophilin family peptidyl-prolyl cis-trans isomerase